MGSSPTLSSKTIFSKVDVIMGTRARRIVTCDIAKLLVLLNTALASEYQAWYQYIVCKGLVHGITASSAREEFADHAQAELGHAEKVFFRILELGGRPALTPSVWTTQHDEIPIEETDVASLLRITLDGERDAIGVYTKIAAFTEGKDFITNSLVEDICADEAEHEQDLEQLLQDLQEFNALQSGK